MYTHLVQITKKNHIQDIETLFDSIIVDFSNIFLCSLTLIYLFFLIFVFIFIKNDNIIKNYNKISLISAFVRCIRVLFIIKLFII